MQFITIKAILSVVHCGIIPLISLSCMKSCNDFVIVTGDEQRSPMIESDTTESSPLEASASLSSLSSDQHVSGSASTTEAAPANQQQSKSLFSVISSAANGKRKNKSKKKSKKDKGGESESGGGIVSKLKSPLKLFSSGNKDGKNKHSNTDLTAQESDEHTIEAGSSRDSVMSLSMSSEFNQSFSDNLLDQSDQTVSIKSSDFPPANGDGLSNRSTSEAASENFEEEEPFDIFAPTPPGRRKLSWAEQVEQEEAANGGHLGFDDNFADNEFILCDGQIFSMSSFDTDFPSSGDNELFPDDDFNRLYDDIMQSVNNSTGDLTSMPLPSIPEETQSCESHDAIIVEDNQLSHIESDTPLQHQLAHLTLEFTHALDGESCVHTVEGRGDGAESTCIQSHTLPENQYQQLTRVGNVIPRLEALDTNTKHNTPHNLQDKRMEDTFISRSDKSGEVHCTSDDTEGSLNTDSAETTENQPLNNLNRPSTGSAFDISHNIHYNRLTDSGRSFDNNNDISTNNQSGSSSAALDNDETFSSSHHKNNITGFILEDIKSKSALLITSSEANTYNCTVTAPAALATEIATGDMDVRDKASDNTIMDTTPGEGESEGRSELSALEEGQKDDASGEFVVSYFEIFWI